jgi:hypothetical protein
MFAKELVSGDCVKQQGKFLRLTLYGRTKIYVIDWRNGKLLEIA